MTLVSNFISLSKIDEKIQEIELSKGDLPSRLKKLEKDIKRESLQTTIQQTRNR